MESKPVSEELPEFGSGKEEPKKKRSRRRIVLTAIGVFLLACCGLIAIVGIFGNPDTDDEEIAVSDEATATMESPTEIPAPTNTPEPTETPAPPTETPAPTNTLQPTATLEPLQALHNALFDAAGPSNRDIEPRLDVNDSDGTIEVMWAINDNFTEDMIKSGAKLDIRNMLEVMANTDYPYETVIFEGTFPLVDAFGNSSEQAVVTAIYERGTIEQINFEGFLTDNVYTIADDAFFHPTFED